MHMRKPINRMQFDRHTRLFIRPHTHADRCCAQLSTCDLNVGMLCVLSFSFFLSFFAHTKQVVFLSQLTVFAFLPFTI